MYVSTYACSFLFQTRFKVSRNAAQSHHHHWCHSCVTSNRSPWASACSLEGGKFVTEAHTESERGASSKLSQDAGDLIPALAPTCCVTLGKSLPFLGCCCSVLVCTLKGLKWLFACLFDRSHPRLVTLPSYLGLPSLGTNAYLTSTRMHLIDLHFLPVGDNRCPESRFKS